MYKIHNLADFRDFTNQLKPDVSLLHGRRFLQTSKKKYTLNEIVQKFSRLADLEPSSNLKKEIANTIKLLDQRGSNLLSEKNLFTRLVVKVKQFIGNSFFKRDKLLNKYANSIQFDLQFLKDQPTFQTYIHRFVTLYLQLNIPEEISINELLLKSLPFSEKELEHHQDDKKEICSEAFSCYIDLAIKGFNEQLTTIDETEKDTIQEKMILDVINKFSQFSSTQIRKLIIEKITAPQVEKKHTEIENQMNIYICSFFNQRFGLNHKAPQFDIQKEVKQVAGDYPEKMTGVEIDKDCLERMHATKYAADGSALPVFDVKFIENKELFFRYVDRFIEEYLYPYLNQTITPANEPKERKALENLLFASLPSLDSTTYQKVHSYAYERYLYELAKDFNRHILNDANIDEMNEHYPKAVVEAVKKDFPSMLPQINEEPLQYKLPIQKKFLNALNQINEEMYSTGQEYCKFQSSPTCASRLRQAHIINAAITLYTMY